MAENPAVSDRAEGSGYLEGNFRLFHLRDSAGQELDFHFHNFDKIVVFIAGSVVYHIEGVSYALKPWDVVYVGHHQIHRAEIDKNVPYERYILYLDHDYIAAHNTPQTDLLHCFDESLRSGQYLARADSKQKVQLMEQLQALENAIVSVRYGSDILKNAVLMQLLVTLNRIRTEGSTFTREPGQSDPKISQVINHINTHLTEDLSIERLAGLCYISKYHFMRRFKEVTGYTVHSYILQKRLILAARLIREGLPVTEAAIQCGFNDYTSFLRAFKKLFNITPGKY